MSVTLSRKKEDVNDFAQSSWQPTPNVVDEIDAANNLDNLDPPFDHLDIRDENITRVWS